jgi:hypothetical protein
MRPQRAIRVPPGARPAAARGRCTRAHRLRPGRKGRGTRSALLQCGGRAAVQFRSWPWPFGRNLARPARSGWTATRRSGGPPKGALSRARAGGRPGPCLACGAAPISLAARRTMSPADLGGAPVRPRPIRPSRLAPLFVLALSAPLSAQDDAAKELRELQPRIDAAIDKGTHWLLGQQLRDGSWPSVRQLSAGASRRSPHTRCSSAACAAHSGDPARGPAPGLDRAAGDLHARVLPAVPACARRPRGKWRMQQLADRLVRGRGRASAIRSRRRRPAGGERWTPEDLSNTQYAALGLRAAAQDDRDQGRGLEAARRGRPAPSEPRRDRGPGPHEQVEGAPFRDRLSPGQGHGLDDRGRGGGAHDCEEGSASACPASSGSASRARSRPG